MYFSTKFKNTYYIAEVDSNKIFDPILFSTETVIFN